MYIREINVENFGPIGNQKFQLCKDKPNVILGHNAMGKTQFLASIYAAFFDEGVLRYHLKSKIIGKTCIKVQTINGPVDFTQYHNNQTSNICFDKFEDVKIAANIDRKQLYFYFPSLDRSHEPKYTRGEIQDAQRFLWNLGIKGHHVLGTCLAKVETDVVMSYGEREYIKLICFLSKLTDNVVFVGDSIFAGMDLTLTSMIVEVLEHMKNVQIILAESTYLERMIRQSRFNVLYLNAQTQEISPVSYNYREIIQSHNMIDNTHRYDAAEDTILPIIYCIGDYLPNGEKYEIELKEIKGNNPCNSIVDNSEIYVNAYLNGSLRGIGKIYFGISNDRRIAGVKLSYEDIDEIQRKLSERLSQADPFVNPDMYNISFNKVATKSGNIQPDIYIIEVDVFPHNANWLYSTSKGDVYVKTVGGKKKLSSRQIQEEIIRRRMPLDLK